MDSASLECTDVGRTLGEFEQLILLALVRLEDDGYGVRIKEEIERRAGREIFIGAVYTALARLTKAGYVSARMGEPTAKRGGRRKKFYRLERAGQEALSASYSAYRNMTTGIEAELEAMSTSRRSS